MTSHWEQLLRVACDLIDRSPLGHEWTFGGGTALMLQIDHRLSQDPARQSLPLCNLPMSYIGDGHRFLKI
ncbi:nucleotidyl transferase AbiEii/AbiGii toxin family protein [Rhizobium wuzhouense]|uniref:nucleotidyl transferase AbiEii/AbiGii toxin family protein n=1 Tax=Rhizobium wuzhouense TaxID=1986026 RepID=UPI003CCA19BA